MVSHVGEFGLAASGRLSDMQSRLDVLHSLPTDQKYDVNHQQEENSATEDDEAWYPSEILENEPGEDTDVYE